MGWLESYLPEIARASGFAETHAQMDSALAYAEQTIQAYTGQPWGASTAFTRTVYLEANSYVLPLPAGVSAISTINSEPAPSGATWQITSIGLVALRDGVRQLWRPGVYVITGTQGSSAIPQAIIKAASLLVGYYLRLSDPERSRYANYMRGDFTGTMRLYSLPVPEVETLLMPYAKRVQVDVV